MGFYGRYIRGMFRDNVPSHGKCHGKLGEVEGLRVQGLGLYEYMAVSKEWRIRRK